MTYELCARVLFKVNRYVPATIIMEVTFINCRFKSNTPINPTSPEELKKVQKEFTKDLLACLATSAAEMESKEVTAEEKRKRLQNALSTQLSGGEGAAPAVVVLRGQCDVFSP